SPLWPTRVAYPCRARGLEARLVPRAPPPMQRGSYDVGSIATLLRQTEANLAVLNRPLEEPRHLLPPAGAYPAASIAADLVAAAAAQPTFVHAAAAPTAAGIAGGAELEAQLGQLRAGVQGLEGRLEDELRAFLAICEKRFQAREEQLRGLAQGAQAAADAACQGAARRVDARLQELERSAQAGEERALHEVWESVKGLQADARAADARARRCALADDVADRIREVEQAGQHRLEERLAVLERRAAEHRAQVESQCEAWKEALGQRCGALEQRLWEQQGDRNDLVDSVLKRLPEAGPVRELREEAKARAYSEEVQLRRLSACEAKLSKLPALEAKVDFAAGQVSQQAEEQAEALRTAVEATQRLSQKLLGLEASCQQADVQAAALEARLEGVLDCGQAGASRGAEALELRLQQRVQEAEARAQRSASRLEQGVAQQLAALSRRVDEEGRDAQQQLEAQLQELEGAQHHLERLASELRAEVAERATDPAAVQQLEAQLGDLRAAQQQQLEKLGELEGAQRQQLAQQLEGLRELEGTHRQQLEHLATELRAEVGEKATDPGALQQLETNQQKLQDQMRELEGAHQQQLEHLAAELRAEVGEKATDPGALQQLEANQQKLQANQQKLQDQMRELERAHQQHLERLAVELRAEAAGAQTAESRMHGVVSELVRADQERRDRQLAGLPSREEFDAVAARVGLFEARAAELAAASAAAQAESAGTRAASARVADLAGGVQDLTSGIEDIRVQVAALEGSLEGSLARAAGSEQRAESACAVVRRLDLELQSMRAGGIDEQLGGRTLDELLDARDAEVLQRSSAALGDVWAELAELRAQLGSTDSQVQALRGARHAVAQPHDALAATRGTSRSPSQAAEAVPRHTRLEERLAQAEAQLDHLRDSQVPKIEARVWDLEKPGLEARTACLERQVAVLEAEGRGALPARKGSSSEEGAPQSVSLSVSALTSRLNRLEDQISGANLEGASLSQLPEPLYVALRLRWPSGSAGAPGPAQISEGELAPILQGILHGAALVQLQRDAGPGGASPRGITCWLAVEDARAAEAELRRQLRAEDSPLRRALPGLLAEESSAALQQAVTSPVTRELASRLDDLERSRELFTSDLEQVEHRVLHVERLAFATPGLGTEALGHPAGLPPAAGELAPLAAHARAHASVHQPPRSAQAAGDDSDEELDFDNEDSQEPGPVWQRRPAPPPAAAGARRQAEPRRSEPGRPAGRRDPLGSSTASSLSGSAADGRLPPAPAQVRGRGVGDRSPLEPAEPEGRAAPPAGSPAEGAPSASQAVTPEAGSQDEGGEPRLQAAGDRSLSALLEEADRASPLQASAGREAVPAPSVAEPRSEPRATAAGVFQDQAAASAPSPTARPPAAGRRRLARATGLPVVARANNASRDEEIQRAFAAMGSSGAGGVLSWDDVRAYLGDHLGFGQADAARLFGPGGLAEAGEVEGVVTLDLFRSGYAALNPYRILTRQDEIIMRKPGSINVQEISLDGLENCEVYICDLTAQADLDFCSGCLILIGPCRGPVSMRDCKNCVCWVAASEFRAKNCQGCTFHLYSRTEPAIEDSEDLVFAPWCASYPRCASQFESAGFDPVANRWNCVVDVGGRRGSPAAGVCCWRVASLAEVVELTVELDERPEVAAPPDSPGPAVTHQAPRPTSPPRRGGGQSLSGRLWPASCRSGLRCRQPRPQARDHAPTASSTSRGTGPPAPRPSCPGRGRPPPRARPRQPWPSRAACWGWTATRMTATLRLVLRIPLLVLGTPSARQRQARARQRQLQALAAPPQATATRRTRAIARRCARSVPRCPQPWPGCTATPRGQWGARHRQALALAAPPQATATRTRARARRCARSVPRCPQPWPGCTATPRGQWGARRRQALALAAPPQTTATRRTRARARQCARSVPWCPHHGRVVRRRLASRGARGIVRRRRWRRHRRRQRRGGRGREPASAPGRFHGVLSHGRVVRRRLAGRGRDDCLGGRGGTDEPRALEQRPSDALVRWQHQQGGQGAHAAGEPRELEWRLASGSLRTAGRRCASQHGSFGGCSAGGFGRRRRPPAAAPPGSGRRFGCAGGLGL
ncbi:unnamed protein product, partial [Prorocentrum cordatum]